MGGKLYHLLSEQIDLSRVKSMDIKNAVNSSLDTMHSALLRTKTYSKTKCCKDVIGKVTKCPLPASNTKASYSTNIQNHTLDFSQTTQKGSVKSLSCAQFFLTAWTAVHQTPLFMELSRHGYWRGLPIPSPGDLPDPGIKPGLPALQGRFFAN